MTKEEASMIGFEIVAYSGDARSKLLLAVEKAKTGDFNKCDQLIEEANACLVDAHKSQTELLQQEARGNHVEVGFITVHAQDHLMTTLSLKDIISNKQNKNITIDLIQDVIAAYFNLRVEDLKSQRRTRNIAYPRQIAMYLSRKLTDMSLPKIGEEFGGRDHTTVIHAYEKISEGLKSDESLQRTIDDITKKITQK